MKKGLVVSILIILFIMFCTVLLHADEIIQGPYDLKEGLEKYKEAGYLVFHVGDDNPLEKLFEGECTWFAYAVTKEQMPYNSGNACAWYTAFQKQHPDRVGQDPKLGAICVWSGEYFIDAVTGERYGHVAKVTKIYPDHSFEIWEANYEHHQITCRHIKDYTKIQGFIYPDLLNEDVLHHLKIDIDKCNPKSGQSIAPHRKAWIAFDGKLADNYRNFITVEGSQCKIVKQDGKEKSVIVFEGSPWIPGNKISIRVDKNILDIYGNHLEKDFQLDFQIEKKELPSTGPATPILPVYTKYVLKEEWDLRARNVVGAWAIRSDLAIDSCNQIWFVIGSHMIVMSNECQKIADIRKLNQFNFNPAHLIAVRGAKIFIIADATRPHYGSHFLVVDSFSRSLTELLQVKPYLSGINIDLPEKMTVDEHGNIFYLIYKKCIWHLYKFSSSGQLIKEINVSNTKQVAKHLSDFGYIYTLECDKHSNVYLSTRSGVLIKLDNNLNIKKTFTFPKDKFREHIIALCFDANNYMYTVFSDLKWRKFDTKMNVISVNCFPDRGEQKDIEVDNLGNVYVATGLSIIKFTPKK